VELIGQDKKDVKCSAHSMVPLEYVWIDTPEVRSLVLKGAKCFGPCGLVITFDHKPTPPAAPVIGMVE
jgi:hypothetical protein